MPGLRGRAFLDRVPRMPIPSILPRARAAATVAFATNGAITATLLARYAEVKAALGVSDGVFGLLVAGFMVGAACALGFRVRCCAASAAAR